MPNRLYVNGFYAERRAQVLNALCILMMGLLLAGCGGPDVIPGSTPTDTANAFIAANEAEDVGQIEGMLTTEMKQAGAMFGSSAAKEILQNREKYGAPIKGQGRVLKVEETTGAAIAHVAVVHDNKCAACKPADFLPDWAPTGSYVDAIKITLQKGQDGKWLINNWETSAYFAGQKQATHTAQAVVTSTRQAASAQETQVVAVATSYVSDAFEAELQDVVMLTQDEGWAVGITIWGGYPNAAILHYSKGKWEPVRTPGYGEMNDTGLLKLYMLSNVDGWTVGDRGVILHYTGGAWEKVESPYANYDLTGLQMLSPTEGWAVGSLDDRFPEADGSFGIILHYVGGKWTRVARANTPRLRDIYISPSQEGWAVGQVILRYTNGAWEQVSDIDLSGSAKINRIQMTSASDGWAVGTAGSGYGAIYRCTAGKWKQVEGPQQIDALNDIDMASPDQGWAVGELGSILHYEGGAWKKSTQAAETRAGYRLHGLYMLSAENGWIVGGVPTSPLGPTGHSTILSYKAGKWSDYELTGSTSGPSPQPDGITTATAIISVPTQAAALPSRTPSPGVEQPTLSPDDATALAGGLPVGEEGAFDPYHGVTPVPMNQEIPLADGVTIKLTSSPYCAHDVCGTTGVDSECGGLMMWVFEISNQSTLPFNPYPEDGSLRQITDAGDVGVLADTCHGFEAVSGVLAGQKGIEPGDTSKGMILFKASGWSKDARTVQLSMIVSGQGVRFSYPLH